MSDNTIHWKYDTMYKWYAKHRDHPEDYITAFIYHTQKCSKKQTHLESFIKSNIVYVGKSPLQDANAFPNGLYTIMDDNAKENMFLYFVYPQTKDCFGKSVTFADHFTFSFNKSDTRNGCHFHQTLYICAQNGPIQQYYTLHTKDNFPSTMVLPREGDLPSIMKKDALIYYKPSLLELMRHPWNHDHSTSGGAKRRVSKPIARPIVSPAFAHLWTSAGFKAMHAFGIPNANGGVTWSVRFTRKGRERNGHAYPAYIFHTLTHSELEFQNTLAEQAHQEI